MEYSLSRYKTLQILVLFMIIHTTHSTKIDQAEETFRVLHEGDVNIQLGNYKNLIVVLGVTGSGKSTLIQYLAGDNNKLIGKRRGFDMIIEDGNKKIGLSTLQSKTLYPELIVDPISGGAFVDCPGFFDTRNSSIEIAASYFIKKVFDQAENVKLVFTISQSALRVGNDRRGLPDLLSYAAGLIKDIDKYKDSISLIVTKVDNYPPMSDEEIIGYIKEFLVESREEIKQKKEEERKMKLNTKMVKFVDHILDESKGSKIGIFRRPDKVGPLSESVLLQNGKAHLQNILYFLTTYTFTNTSDFSYSLSSDSKLYIKDILTGIIDGKIINFLSKLSRDLTETYTLKAERSNKMIILRDQLENDNIIFSKIFINLKEKNKLNSAIIECMRYVETDVYDKEKINEIYSLIAQSNAFKTFIDDTNTDFLVQWTKSLKEFIYYLRNLRNWYIILPDMYNAMSTYNFQKQRETYIKKFGGDFISEKNLKLFLARAGDFNLKNLSILNEIAKSDLNIDDFIFRDINKVLSANIKSQKFQCLEFENFEAFGNTILLSEVVQQSKLSCSKPIKTLKIFALETFYIDESIDFTGYELQVSIIAPNWVVIGNVELRLDGLTGKLDKNIQAKSGTRPGEQGADGSPGSPGGLSGSFFGIVLTCKDCKNLQLFANGGSGGPGYNGGKGAKGKDGTIPDLPYGGDKGDFENGLRSKGYEFSLSSDNDNDHYVVYRKSKDFYIYKVNGLPGSLGSRGGNGGVGGIGASPGFNKIIELGSASHIKTVNNPGSLGKPGRGGEGGEPGASRGIKNLKCSRRREYIIGIKTRDSWGCDILNTEISPYAKGANGFENSNKRGLKLPSVPKKHLSIPEIIKFKTFLRNYVLTTMEENLLLKFLSILDQNEKIQNEYTVIDFVQDYKELEGIIYTKEMNSNYVQVYDSTLKGIQFALSRKSNAQDLKLLSFVYTAILSKLSNLKYNSDKFLIIDLKTYVDFASQNVNNLKDNGKSIVVEDIKNTYELSIDKTIADIKSFIDDHINIEFEILGKELDASIEDLLNETIHLKKQAEKKKIELLKLERETRKELEKQKKFNIFKFAGNVLSFFGPLSSLVTDLTGALTNTLGSDIFGVFTNHFEFLKPISSAIKEIDGKITGFLKEGKSKVDGFFSFANIVVDKVKIFFPHLASKLSATINGFKENVIDKDVIITEEIINKYKNRFLGGITDVIDNITTTKYSEAETKNLTSFLSNIKELVPFAEVASEEIGKYQHDNEKLREIGQAIIDTQLTIKNLDAFQYNIYHDISPFLIMVQKDVNDLLAQLNNKTQASLDFSKWNVQKYIRKATLQVKRFVEGFETKDEFVRCFEQLEELSNLLIGLFDRIQIYQEQKRLADYIAMVSSPNFRALSIKNPNQQKAINELEFVIGSNIVIGQCNRIVSSFKQQVFPFGEYFFENNKDRLTMNSDKKLEDMVSDAVDKIKFVKSKLIEIETSIISGRDKFTHYSVFSSDYKSSKPFYEWNFINYPNEIKKLFNGEEISLLADVTNSGDKNAVKFTNLELNIKLKNESFKHYFENIIKNFDIEMTHLGNSYYKCDARYFVIHTESQTISYSFERDVMNKPIRSNQVYSKIINGDILLSPYATWNIRLVASSGLLFDKLSKYIPEVRLELIGKGQFVDAGSNVCRGNLEDYYEKYEVTMTDIYDFIRNDFIDTNIV